MQKRDLFIGLGFGLITCFISLLLVIMLFTKLPISEGFDYVKNSGTMGKVVTLAAIPNFILFFVLLKKDKDLMAKGIILSMFIITAISLIL